MRFDQRQLSALGLTIGDVAAQIGRRNVDVSAGDVGGAGNKRLLRTLQKRQDSTRHRGFATTGSQPDDVGNVSVRGLPTDEIRVRRYEKGCRRDFPAGIVRRYELEIRAHIERIAGDDEQTILFNGKPAVEFRIAKNRAVARIGMRTARTTIGIEEAAKLPPSMQLTIHSERWLAIESRMDLLLKNLLQGLVLVLAFLFLFLPRVCRFGWRRARIKTIPAPFNRRFDGVVVFARRSASAHYAVRR